MRFLLPALLAAMLVTPALANEVYRTVDERGVVHYSDRPLSDRSQLVKVESKATDPARAAAESRALLEGDPQREQRGMERQAMAAAQAEQADIRAEDCRQARAAVETYERSPRLYETLPEGGRRYLSEEEMITARAQARQAVLDYCDD